MTTRECFDRLAAVGVRVDGLTHCPGNYWSCRESPLWFVPELVVVSLLCNAVLERHPDWTVEQLNSAGEWDVFSTAGEIKCVVSNAPTRLAALTLAAERVAKENGNG